jgi:hypothetical protein
VSALALLQCDPVKKLEAMRSKADNRIALLAAKAEEIDPAEDPAAVVSAGSAVAIAKAEKLVIEKALGAAQKAAAAAAVAEKARLAEARRARLVARAEALQVELVEVLTHAAVLVGENVSITSALPGPDAMRFWIGAAVEEASKRACKGVKPKTCPTISRAGTKYTLVTNPMARTLDLQFQVPLIDVE